MWQMLKVLYMWPLYPLLHWEITAHQLQGLAGYFVMLGFFILIESIAFACIRATSVFAYAMTWRTPVSLRYQKYIRFVIICKNDWDLCRALRMRAPALAVLHYLQNIRFLINCLRLSGTNLSAAINYSD
ncbi:hypothetical protein [Sporomusa aerivorans]|uniref:hypothetical protein n=1 Tax=Sporomusa aerivorans TaxID=204936 RepID=UPI00352BA5D7